MSSKNTSSGGSSAGLNPDRTVAGRTGGGTPMPTNSAGRTGTNGGVPTPANGGIATRSGGVNAGAGFGGAGALVAPPANAVSFHDERDDVLGVINELEEQLDRYERNRIATERTLAETTEKLTAATQRAQELEWQTVAIQTRLDALEQVRHENGVLEEQINAVNQRAQITTQQLATAEQENSRLAQELKRAEKQVEELFATRRDRDALRGETIKLEARMNEQARNITEISTERSQLQSQLHDAQASLEETRAVRQQLETAVRAYDERARAAGQTAESLNEKIEAMRAEKKNLLARITHLERENTRIGEQRHALESELSSLRVTTRDSETALAGVKKAFNEVRLALAETTARTRRRATQSWPRTTAGLRGIDGVAGTNWNDAIGEADAGATSMPSAEFSFSNNAPTLVGEGTPILGGGVPGI